MGKAAREKWERRMEMLRVAAQGHSPRTSIDHNTWLTWISTFGLGAIGIAVSNGPWQLSTAIFVLALLAAWTAAVVTIRRSSRSTVKALAAVTALALSILVVWIANWIIRVPVQATEATKATFIKALNVVPQKPDFVLLSCPRSNEVACAFAEEFIPILQRAGWKVDGPLVRRESLGRYANEVLIGDYGPDLIEPQNPDVGVWTRLMPWRMQEELAFKQIGITVKAINDPELPQTQTRIYFGKVPTRTLFQIVKSWLS